MTSYLKLTILVSELELDDSADIWDDMDYFDIMDKDTVEFREENSKGCYWNCCEKPGLAAVCHPSGYRPKVREKRPKA